VIALAAGLAFVLPAGVAVPRDHQASATRDEAMAAFEAVVAREAADPHLRDDCHSRLLEPDAPGSGSGTAVLLLHGYTNCPKQFDVFAEELTGLGYTVYVPRAPFHGEDPDGHSPLGSLGAQDLAAFADEAVDIAAGLGDRLVVLGLSGGGTLTSYAAQYRSEVDLAIPIAPFLGVPAIPGPVTPALINASTVLPVIDMRDPPPDADVRGGYPHGFSDTSLQGAAAYMRLGHQVIGDAATATPAARRIIAVINDADDQVSNPMVADLAARWTATAPGSVEVVHLDASLGLLHDLITPDRKGAKPDVAYPRLLGLIGRS
jgi:carboxylesterase